MRLFCSICLTCLLAASLGPCGRAKAAEDAGAPSSSTVFGRELYGRIKRGIVYIGIMAPADYAFGVLQFQGSGSGVIFQGLPDENAAYALTNHHVAGDSAVLQVELWDRSTYRADLVATEPGLDVALIKIRDIAPDAYEVCPLGDSDRVLPGDPALAVGAPGNFDRTIIDRQNPETSDALKMTVTMRVVTGFNSDPMELLSWWSGWKGDLGRQVLTNLPKRMQTQSTINPGNSGGPLFNSRGEVIGLNHAHLGAGPVFTQNHNYTIPINYAKNFAYQVINTGSYDIPWMGLDMLGPPTFTSSQQVEEFIDRWYDPALLKVYGIRKDSPAERAGFRTGDIILEFDGKLFASVQELRLYAFEQPIGKVIPVRVQRGRLKLHLSVEIGPKRSYDSEFSF